jgi:hypothetical protein
MKKLLLVTLLAPTVAGLLHAAPPPITLTVKSYRALTNHLVQIAEAAAPGTGSSSVGLLGNQLGSPALKGVNLDQPWQIGIWLEGFGGQPSMSVWIPTTDFEAFSAELQDGSLLKGWSEPNPIKKVGTYAAVWIPGTASSASAQTAHGTWTPEAIGSPREAIQLQIAPGEPLRQQLLQGLGMVRLTLGSALGNPQAQAVPGVDSRALADLLSLYLDLFETAFKGMDRFTVGLDLQNGQLRLRKQLTAQPGSDLASWLQDGESSLESVLPYANSPAPVSFAMRWNGSAALMPTLKKLTRLSLQLQGMPAESESVKETEKLLELLVPFKAAGYLSLSNELAFAGVYEFPGRDLKEIYRLMQNYLQTSMQSQVGEDKPYKTIRFDEAKRQLAGTRVDRVTMEVNLDAPLYQMPGQREMIESIWPGGRMEFDYAMKGDRMFIATPALLDGYLAQTPSATAAPTALNRHTVLFAKFNLLQVIPWVLRSNPMLPDDFKQTVAKLDHAGTDVTLQVDLNGSLSAEAVIPLKLVSTMRELAPQ